MLFAVPESVSDELAVFADPFSVSLHAITRHPPPRSGRVLVYGAGSLGLCAVAILRALYPDVAVAVIARFAAQAQLARQFGAAIVLAHEPRLAVIEELVGWGGGRLWQPLQGLPMAYPGAVDVVYDTVGKPETFEVGVRVLAARGTLVKAGVHAPGRWEWSPLYFKEISWVGSNAFGVEEVDGHRQHAIAHYLDLVVGSRIDLRPMLTHTFRLEQWRDAFLAIANQGESGAVKVAFDQR
jgi:threonine dehydrogenase-like Zn-dependent dehydrogenase